MPDDTSRGGDIPMPCMSYKEARISLGQTINFIDNWLQCFEYNYDLKKILVNYPKQSQN